jgi:putative ATP-dependent endonuclease of OLD family
MKIAAISIQKYRSIKRTPRLNLGDMTVLVGPNNEGKSNVLRALVVSMQVLRLYGFGAASRVGSSRAPKTQTKRAIPRRIYDWSYDFPKDLQDKTPDGNTIIDLWFDLNPTEQVDFQAAIGSRLRTELPIRLTIGPRTVEFAVRKQGPGGAALTRKAPDIAQFIGRSLRVEYVESVRTAARAKQVVEDMVEIELQNLAEESEFSTALQTLVDAVKPMTERLSADLAGTLQAFLPEVEGVEIALGTERILSALSAQVQIVVDDGVATELQHKGDGVQSLAALALVRKAADVRRGALFLAIEEPEAHLHPKAVHQLRNVLSEIAATQQVVLTTHSAALVNRLDVENNILVRSNRAAPAARVGEIRDALGIRVGDNLSQADLILLVEGGCDSAALSALLSHQSPALREALTAGLIAIEALGSASNLSARLDGLRNMLCRYHVLLDDDDAGRSAGDRARGFGLLTPLEENFTTVPGLRNAEFEDAVDPRVYMSAIRTAFGVNLGVPEFRHARAKWSDRVGATFRAQGKNWSDAVKTAVKTQVALEIAKNPQTAIHPQKSQSLLSLVAELERRIQTKA